jgi:hypothetical protein
MTHADINIAASAGHAPQKSRKQRLIVLGILGLCGAMIFLVLLSNPRVMAKIDNGISSVKSGISDVISASSATSENPASKTLPVTRIRVRRAGVISED